MSRRCCRSGFPRAARRSRPDGGHLGWTLGVGLPALAALAAGCSSDTSLATPARCNPLGAAPCLAPWPSSMFEVDDPATATGRRLAIPDGALPANADGVQIDPRAWNTADGFSPAAPIVMAWPGGVSADDLPPADNMDRARAADSPTVLLDLTTGERVAHFAELGPPGSQALVLRPAARLAGGRRYAVAITRAVRAADGDDLAVPPGFAAIRDGVHTDHELLETMRPRAAEVLDALDAAGVAPGELVVAWDFTVASDAGVAADAALARDLALAAAPPALAITGDGPAGDGGAIRRRITGTLEAPRVLAGDGAPGPGVRLARDPDGRPALHGTHAVAFAIVVPACARPPAPIVIHRGAGVDAVAAELCLVTAAVERRAPDLATAARALGELGFADDLADLGVQDLVDHLALARALRTTLAGEVIHAGDPSRLYYHGDAGGLALVAHDPGIARAAITVAEAPRPFAPPLREILDGAYPDPLDAALALHLLAMRHDRTAALPAALADRQVLLQVTAPSLDAWWLARSLGAPLVEPAPMTPWGVPTHPSPLTAAAALSILDPRGALRQARDFFTTGRITAAW